MNDREAMAIGHIEIVLRTLGDIYDDQKINQGETQGMIDQLETAIRILKGDPS